MKKRVAVTGLGIISSAGLTKENFWLNVSRGNSFFIPITLFDTAGLKTNLAGQINYDPKEIFPNVNLRDFDRASILLLSATKRCLDDARLVINDKNNREIGVSVGTTFGSLYSISEFDKESLKEGPQYVNPSVFPSTTGNSPASKLSILFKIKGFNATLSTGMSAALDAIAYACDFLALDRAKIIFAGSLEALSPQIFLGFYKLNYLAGLKPGTKAISCPFDKRRNGIMLSEGSAVFTLEKLDAAKKRGAHIYAEILGIGSSFDYTRFYNYNPRARGMKQAMRAALKDASLEPKNIDCIFANANSTVDADLFETNAIKEVFGEYASKIPITAIKSVIGETYSASGGLALAAALSAIENNIIPPTANLIIEDPECDLDYVPNIARKKKVNRVMINSFGPNGWNVSLIAGRPQ